MVGIFVLTDPGISYSKNEKHLVLLLSIRQKPIPYIIMEFGFVYAMVRAFHFCQFEQSRWNSPFCPPVDQ
jgi:hypothetical protein